MAVGYYTPSRLGDYLQCPLKYRFAHIDKIPRKTEGIEAFVGSCVHSALERMLVLKKDFDREPSLELAEELYLKAWEEDYHPGILVRQPDLTPEDYKRRGLMMLRNYFEIEAAQEFGRLMDLEKYLRFPLGENDIAGKVDRLQRDGDTIHVIDYKTSKSTMSQESADDDIQLALYELGIRQEFPDVESVQLHWYMLAHSQVVTSIRDEEARRNLAERISRIATEIETTTEFRPSEGTLCGWCDYQAECEEEKRSRTLRPAPEQLPGAGELADEYAELSSRKTELNSQVKDIDKRLEELKPIIGAVCRDQGAWSVEGSEHILDVEYGTGYYMPSPNTQERARLDDLVRRAGFWDEVSYVSTTKVMDALDEGRFGELSADVEGAFNRKETLKIKVRGRDEVE
jgi:putative RecB family exonuclease